MIHATALPHLRVVPSHINLVQAEDDLREMPDRERRLDATLEALHDKFDFVVIDCTPSLGLLGINSLVAANTVIIPVPLMIGSITPSHRIFDAIRAIQKGLNRSLSTAGVFIALRDSEREDLHGIETDGKRLTGFPYPTFKTSISYPVASTPSQWIDSNREDFVVLAQEILDDAVRN